LYLSEYWRNLGLVTRKPNLKTYSQKQAAVSPPDTPSVDKTNWVINSSSRSLSDAEIIAKLESVLRQLSTPDTVRRAVKSILQQAKPPKPNIMKEMRDVLECLKEEYASIIVLPADKGHASIVTDEHLPRKDVFPDRERTVPAPQ